jgi:hypothetical protein
MQERDPHPEQRRQRELYMMLMEELKRRRNVIADVLQGKFALPQGIGIELCYLQLRMICELIALGCLAAHGDIPGTKTGKIHKAFAPGVILSELERLHPEFYPVPGEQVRAKDGSLSVRSIKDGFLTKNQLLLLWAESGNRLHRGSMKNVERPFAVDFEKIAGWDRRILRLLSHHQISLKDDRYQMWVLMQSEKGGRLSVHLMEKVGPA